MSDKDDPFGLSSDAGRTRIRPVSGAGQRAPSPPTYGAAPGGGRGLWQLWRRGVWRRCACPLARRVRAVSARMQTR